MALTKLNNQSLSAVTSAGIPIRTGTVLQVVYHENDTAGAQITSSSFVAVSGFAASITPISTSSKVLVLVNSHVYNTVAGVEACLTIYRDSTNIGDAQGITSAYTGVSTDNIMPMSMQVLDSPSSTSALTYAVYIRRNQGSNYCQINLRQGKQSITLMEIAG